MTRSGLPTHNVENGGYTVISDGRELAYIRNNDGLRVYIIDKPRQVNRLGIEFELAGLDLREVQYLVDEAEQVGAVRHSHGAAGSSAFSVPKRAALEQRGTC